MALVNLFNVPRTPAELLVWSFHHADQHTQIIQSIANQKNVALVPYVLDPIPPADMANWLRRHQTAHDAFNAELNAAGQDLTSIDFGKPEQLVAWIEIHAAEHLNAANVLRI